MLGWSWYIIRNFLLIRAEKAIPYLLALHCLKKNERLLETRGKIAFLLGGRKESINECKWTDGGSHSPEAVDRVPNAPFYEAPVCRYFGKNFRAALLEDFAMTEAHLQGVEAFQFDWVMVGMGLIGGIIPEANWRIKSAIGPPFSITSTPTARCWSVPPRPRHSKLALTWKNLAEWRDTCFQPPGRCLQIRPGRISRPWTGRSSDFVDTGNETMPQPFNFPPIR